MTTLCAIKWSVIVVVCVSLIVFSFLVGAALGWNKATRGYWKMLNRAGSRASTLGAK